MGNTKWYNEFKEWLGKIGSREGDYYLPDHFLDELSDSERDEAETIMYEVFKSDGDGTGYFAQYMRYLRN